jgi:hypothetical protein
MSLTRVSGESYADRIDLRVLIIRSEPCSSNLAGLLLFRLAHTMTHAPSRQAAVLRCVPSTRVVEVQDALPPFMAYKMSQTTSRRV